MSSFFNLVAQLQASIDALDAILTGDENSTVDVGGVTKDTISKAIKDQFASLKAMVQGRQSFATKAAMDADLAHAADTLAEVWNDPAEANNGLYGKTGASGTGSWVKSPYDSYALLQADIGTLEQKAEMLDRQIPQEVLQAGFRHSIDTLLKILAPTGLEAGDEIAAAIADEDGNAALVITKLGEIIVPLLRALSLKVGMEELTGGEYNYALGLIDEAGYPVFGVDVNTGGTLMALARVLGILEIGTDAQLQQGEFNYDFAIADASGYVGFGLSAGVVMTPGQSLNVDLERRDQLNIAKSNQLKQSINTTCAQNVFDYNHVVVYGQSLSTGHEGWPALSKTPRYGNLMLGDSIRPSNSDGAGFTPFGGAALQPLIANVQSGGVILTDQEVAELIEGDGALGETVNTGMVNFAKKLHNRSLLVDNDSQRVFVTTNCGVSGKTIEQLSKVNTQDGTDRYSRYTGAVSQVKAIADGESKSYGVTGIVWMQGEWNYTDHGDVWDKASYKSALTQLRDDMVADALVLTGQADEPAFFTYQTGAAYTRDEDSNSDPGLHVGMAQWEFVRENPNCYLAGPVYPYTDKGGHLDANGYRWYGNLLGKVFHKVVTLGQQWRPLSPRRAQQIGREIYIDFHVPEPPLVFDLPYVVNSATDYSSKGFRVTDDIGEVLISRAEIVGETIVKLQLGRDTIGGAHIWYADKTRHNGNGCLRDSDETVALDKYEYKPAEGMYASANLPELIDKPYPLHNWCIAFYIPTNWENS